MLLTWNICYICMFTERVIPKSVELKAGTRGGIKKDRGAAKMRQDGWQKWIRGGGKNEIAGVKQFQRVGVVKKRQGVGITIKKEVYFTLFFFCEHVP